MMALPPMPLIPSTPRLFKAAKMATDPLVLLPSSRTMASGSTKKETWGRSPSVPTHRDMMVVKSRLSERGLWSIPLPVQTMASCSA